MYRIAWMYVTFFYMF